MNDLQIPAQFKGSWEHLLILTYGADLPFFENALWRQLSKRCRNKVILADGRQYLSACKLYARGGQVRHLNHRYVVEGIFTPHAAHSKVILLTNPQEGQLLIGSGNLGWQGYASGGEQFTLYAYTEDAPEALNAFLAIRDVIDILIEQRYVSGPVEGRLRSLWEKTPWFFKSPVNTWQPVRHNLKRSFLDQLRETIGDDPVEELWVLAPFYDREAHALERLLNTFNPRQATLLVQSGSTSVDSEALQRMLDRFAEHCRLCTFTKSGETPYVHAKFYLFKLKDRAVCLQGSPNLSQAAMLRTAPHGNVEIANLLSGSRDTFDELLAALDIQPVLDIEALDLSYQSPSPILEDAEAPWHLTGGEWRGDRLSLRYQGTLPALPGARLRIAGLPFTLNVCDYDERHLELALPQEAVSLLRHPVPVSLVWESDNALDSNPVFVCNLDALDREIDETDDRDVLPGIGDLDLDDEEFERLLGELESSLVIDRQSVWQLAGRSASAVSKDGDDKALRVSYEEIDYEALRRHPRIQQYIRPGTGGAGSGRTRLQIILSAITDHFQGLMDTAAVGHTVGRVLDALDEEGEGETDADDGESYARGPQVPKQRICNILKHFIRRYLRGLRSPDFLEIAGFEVVGHNYIIFSHVLWRLLTKDWVEHTFVLEAFLKMWRFFWGSQGQMGYFKTLSEEQQAQVLQWIHERHSEATLLAALYYGAYLTRTEEWKEQRFALRDFGRHLLADLPFEVTFGVLEMMWVTVSHINAYHPPIPSEIVAELESLMQFETRATLLRTIEQQQGFPRLSCDFLRGKIRQRAKPVKILTIKATDALADKETALKVLSLWMQMEDLDYYRIHHPETGRLLFYDMWDRKGTYWAKDRGEAPEYFEAFTPQPTAWGVALRHLQELAKRLDAQLVINLDHTVKVPVSQT